VRLQTATSRRDFLRVAAGVAGASTGLALTACGSSKASLRPARSTTTATTTVSAPKLRAQASVVDKRGVQHLRSRSDMRPPEIRIDHHAGKDVSPGVVVTDAHGGPSRQGPVILDTSGRMVWFLPLAPPGSSANRAFNVRVQTYHGQPVLTWFEGNVVSAHGLGHYEIYDQQYRQVAQVHARNGYQGDLHDFLLTDTGTALFTCYGRATGNLPGGRRGAYFYGVVQEVDVATGKLLFQWRSDKHVGLSASFERVPAKASNTWDYFHINSIAIDPTDQNLLISSRNTWAVYKVNRRTGRVMWKLGGKGSNFKMGPGTHFAFQHHVTLHPGGILTIFDNEGGPPKEASQSRGLVLSINESRRTAHFVRQYHHRPPVMSEALGSVQTLANGHMFIGWGSSSYFTEYGSGGQVLFDGRLSPGTSSYRAFKETWNGTPASSPAVTTARAGSAARVFVSWNGATDVAQWSVWGGRDARALSHLGLARVAGFETEISVPDAPAVVSVQAIGSNGSVLSKTRAVRT
jgi:hypothetical protein